MCYNVKRMCIKSSPEGGGGKAPPPYPSPIGRGVISEIPLLVRENF